MFLYFVDDLAQDLILVMAPILILCLLLDQEPPGLISKEELRLSIENGEYFGPLLCSLYKGILYKIADIRVAFGANDDEDPVKGSHLVFNPTF